jgi:hypothetical protein
LLGIVLLDPEFPIDNIDVNQAAVDVLVFLPTDHQQ